MELGTLARLPMIGGTPRELAEDVFHADWSPNGKDIAAIRKVGATYQLEVPLGNVIHSTPGWMSYVRYSPDGTQISFLDHPGQGSNSGHVCVIRPGEPPRRLTPRTIPTLWRSAWSPDGKEIWYGVAGDADGDGVFGVTLDGVVRHVYSSPGFAGVDDTAADGSALLVTVRPRMLMETSTRAGGVNASADLSWMDWSLLRDINPAGTMVLFDENGPGGGPTGAVFIRSLNGEPPIRLSDGLCSTFSEDGRFVLAGLMDKDDVWIVPTGVGSVRTLPVGNLRTSFAEWLRGSDALVVVASEPGEGRRLYRLDLGSGAIQRMHDTVLGAYAVAVSPDGAFGLSRRVDGLLALFPTDGAPERPFPELDNRYRPAGWAGDSRSFYVLLANVLPGEVFRVDAGTGAMEPWLTIEPRVRAGVDGINGARVTRDGERYVYNYMRTDSVLYHAQGLR